MEKEAAEKQNTDLPLVRISVRNLVEFLLRSGDINAGMPSGRDQESMLAGSRIHRKIQKKEQKRTFGNYMPEVPLRYDKAFDSFILRVEGRADGIIGSSLPDADTASATIDEIKGMYLDVTRLEEPFKVHLAQAKSYAAMYAHDKSLPFMAVQMTYVNLDTEEIRRFSFSYESQELENWFEDLLREYYKWAAWQLGHKKTRNKSMEHLEFPFPYRKGQRKLTAAVYHTILEGKELFLMAPTGVGKTMSCVFPAVRAIGEGHGERIFYLTAKNETLSAGREAFAILREHGLEFKTVQMTSKEKICPLHEPVCTPEDCPYARGHYDRINDALFAVLTEEKTAFYDRENILSAGEKFSVCPYELTRDLAEWCDAVLCDYNYVFDPDARLRKFFGEGAKSGAIILVDEAHNLADRGREMFSAYLCKEHVLAAKRAVPKQRKKLRNALSKVNQLLLEEKRRIADGALPAGKKYLEVTASDLEQILYASLHAYEAMQDLFRESTDGELKEKLLDFYFELGNFCGVLQEMDDSYQPYLTLKTENHPEKQEDDGSDGKRPKTLFSVRLFCVNPASRITECISKGRAAVFFSATLLPVSYYKKLLTVRDDCYAVYAESPFPREHRCILIGRDVSTRYTQRGPEMYRKIAGYLSAVARSKTGNYLAFFPSYRMMRDVFEAYKEQYDCPEVNYVMQGPFMSETDREIFLENFYENTDCSLLAFAVMGGVFSEGIDLTGTKLIGAVVVGEGLPQVSAERNVLKEYYERQGLNGFSYAYLYPGLNKVEQAAGRVIRTDTDRGVILLLDDRFLQRSSRELFPREWSGAEVCTMDTVRAQLAGFWNRTYKEDENDSD